MVRQSNNVRTIFNGRRLAYTQIEKNMNYVPVSATIDYRTIQYDAHAYTHNTQKEDERNGLTNPTSFLLFWNFTMAICNVRLS